MNKLLKYIFPIAVLFFSCHKDLTPSDESPVPVFKVAGETSAGTFIFEAGVDSLYLFTHYQLDSGMVNLTGTFANAGCTSPVCPGSLSFTFKIKENEGLSEVLNFPFLNEVSPVSSFQTLTVTPTDTVNRNFTIEVAGQTSSNLPTQVNVFSNEGLDIKVYALDRVNLVKSTSLLHFLPAYPDSCKSVKLLAKVHDNKVSLRTEIQGSNLNYSWSNGAFDTSELTIGYVQQHEYAVTVTEIDHGCTTIASLSNLPSETGNEWIPSTGLDVTTSGIQYAGEQPGVRIEWTNLSGVKFSSSMGVQSAGSFFTISKVSPFKANENRQSTVQIHIHYQCLMVGDSASGAEPVTMSGEGIIGVAIPD